MRKMFGEMKEKKDAKEAIIDILSKQWPLTAKKIYFEIKKQHHLPITYQAIHKALNYLIEETVIKKEGMEYALSFEWLDSLKKFSEKTQARYFNKKFKNEKKIMEYFKKNKHMEFYFETNKELGDFVINEFLKFPNTNKKPAVYRWRHMYCLIGLPDELFDSLRKGIGNEKQYILCQKKDSFDVFLAETYKKMGGNVKLGVMCARAHDTFVRGDFELRVFWSHDPMQDRDELYKTFNKARFNLDEMHKMTNTVKRGIFVVLSYSPEIAKKTREETLKYFK